MCDNRQARYDQTASTTCIPGHPEIRDLGNSSGSVCCSLDSSSKRLIRIYYYLSIYIRISLIVF